MPTLYWNPERTPAELHAPLHTLGGHYPIRPITGRRPPPGAPIIEWVPGGAKGSLSVSRTTAGLARVEYDRPYHALRAVGALLAGLVQPNAPCAEQAPFETLGVMLDCSRNAVMKPDHVKAWLRQLALLGFNMAMLYTEDTYELPGEEYFGYLRGRYTAEELRDLDAYAAGLGIELIGCIQTLGHLEQIMKWPPYGSVKDTASVLLVDEAKTYALIEKMIAAYAQAFRSRRIHVGMDETHDLGRGRFMDLHGPRRGYELFSRHLQKVVKICARHGLKPMLWSDMYFRMGSKAMSYYDPTCRIPEDVRRNIPTQAQLVYWDYYHEEEEFYLDWIQRHRELGCEPVMASGIWTWYRLTYDHGQTEKNLRPCLSACRRSRLKEVFFTLWGDDGGFCEFDTALAGLAHAAEIAYAGPAGDPVHLARRYHAVTGADLKAVLAAADLHVLPQAASLLWDDPLLGIYRKERAAESKNGLEQALKTATRVCRTLAPFRHRTQPVDLAHLWTLAELLRKKLRFHADLETAYRNRNRPQLRRRLQEIPALTAGLDAVLTSFRRQWFRRNKPQGFETLQIRLGGQKERYRELGQRLRDLLDGRADHIPELDETPAKPAGILGRWKDVMASSIT